MTTVQTIQLDDNERLALQKALGIIDKIANIAKVSMDNVFDYLCEAAEIAESKGEHKYFIKAIHNIDEMR